MTEWISKNLEDTEKIAIEIASHFTAQGAVSRDKATVVGLYGELGAGKTTFMKYFAKALGVTEEIQSPTFIIMRIFNFQFSIFKKLIHVDAYRLESGEELLKLGWAELISDPKNLICIEWPEKVAEVMPKHFMLRFGHAGEENTRKISFA